MSADLSHFMSVISTTDPSSISRNNKFLFQVLGFYCYIADFTYLSSLPSELKPEGNETIYLYDIIITDGRCMQKCVLNPKLHSLVQKRILQVGYLIYVKQAILAYHERDEYLFQYAILCDVEVTDKKEKIPLLNGLSFLSSQNKREINPCPLVTGRIYYLNTWFMHIPYLPLQKSSESLKYNKNNILTHSPVSLRDLAKEWKTISRPYPPLLVAVILQGKLHHYGTNASDKPYPFQGYVEVADETGICSMVSWDAINISLFTSIQPGTVLLLQNYNVVQKYPRHGTPAFRRKLKRLEQYHLELKLNRSSTIHIVEREDIKDILKTNINLPIPEYWFANRNLLGQLSVGSNVDVVGIVTYVGRYNRERCMDANGKPKGGFWVYRWVDLIDDTSFLPIVLQFYINDQLDVHNELKPGQILICSQLRITYTPLLITGSCQRREFYLTTTSESKLHICDDKSYDVHKELLSLVDMSRKNEEKMNYIKTYLLRMGGKCYYSSCQKSIETFQAANSDEQHPFQIKPCHTWKKEINDLSYKEHRRIVVIGIIVQVVFIKFETENGWVKNCSKYTQHTLFVDIVRQHCKSYESIGNTILHPDSFPHKYTAENEEMLLKWHSFTPFSADKYDCKDWEEKIQDVPKFCHGYYLINIIGINPGHLLHCMLIPEPTETPHPDFLSLLSGKYNRMSREYGGLHTKYKNLGEEVKRIQATAFKVEGMKLHCILDLYCHSMGNVEIILRQAFPCKDKSDNK